MRAPQRTGLASFALAAFLALPVGPIHAGPTQPPAGPIAGFRVRYQTSALVIFTGERLRIACYNPTSRTAHVGFDIFDGVADPDRDPLMTSTLAIGPTEVSSVALTAIGHAVARVSLQGKKDVIDCRAYVEDQTTAELHYEVALHPVGRKNR